jgi:hypothetical protein
MIQERRQANGSWQVRFLQQLQRAINACRVTFAQSHQVRQTSVYQADAHDSEKNIRHDQNNQKKPVCGTHNCCYNLLSGKYKKPQTYADLHRNEELCISALWLRKKPRRSKSGIWYH